MEEVGLIPLWKGLVSAVCGVISTIVGGFDSLFILFCLFVALDFFTGVASAIKRKKFRSAIMRWGALNKCIEVIIIIVFYYADIAFGTEMLRNAAIIWFLICEGSSIVENCVTLKIPMPEGLGTVLKQLKKTVSINFVDIACKVLDDKISAEIREENKKDEK